MVLVCLMVRVTYVRTGDDGGERMLPEWQAHIDDLLERYRQQRDQLGELRRAADEARSQADGKVRAALTPVRPPDRAEPAADSAAAGGAGSGPGPGPLDLAESLPERPEDLDAFRERHGSP